MRLTLRTLLAYIDGILDPADQEDLGRRIDENATASELIHLTRDVTRRLRLPAPPLEDDPSGFDPNAVAEYLDGAATPEAMEAFEKHCLTSESHLAEVASCHHVLTMVLGERANVDPETRRRMYAIPEVAAALAKQANSTPAAVELVDPRAHLRLEAFVAQGRAADGADGDRRGRRGTPFRQLLENRALGHPPPRPARPEQRAPVDRAILQKPGYADLGPVDSRGATVPGPSVLAPGAWSGCRAGRGVLGRARTDAAGRTCG